MIKLSQKCQEELEKLFPLVVSRRKEAALEDIHLFFSRWGEPKKEKKKAEEKIYAFHHLCESLKNTDPFVLVADAISDEVLSSKDLSKDLYQAMEVVVRLMKN